MAGYPDSNGSMNTPTVGGPYYEILFADTAGQGIRVDLDFIDNGMTGDFSMATNINSNDAQANQFPHVVSSSYRLRPGTSMYCPNSSAEIPEINLFADTDNTYTPQGALVNEYPIAFVTPTNIADTDQYNTLRTRRADQRGNNDAPVANGLVISDYPYNRFRPFGLNTDNSIQQCNISDAYSFH